MNMQPKICVIIPCRGAGETLERCVQSILDCDYPGKDIVVVDDGLDPLIRRKLYSFGGAVRVLESLSRGPSYARNLAAGATEADYLAFTDSDCFVSKEWLKELLRGFQSVTDAVACGGPQRLPDDASAFERQVFIFMEKSGFVTDYVRSPQKDAIIEVDHNPSCNVMYRREVFMQEEGFLIGLWPGEDVELDHRLRMKRHIVLFNPSAVVYHYKPKTLKKFSRMMYNYGYAQGRLVRS